MMNETNQSERRARFLAEMGIEPETLRPPSAILPAFDSLSEIDDSFIRRSDFVNSNIFVDDTPPIGSHSSSPMNRARLNAKCTERDSEADGAQNEIEKERVPLRPADEFSCGAAIEAYNRLHVTRRQAIEEFRRRKAAGIAKTLPPPKLRPDAKEIQLIHSTAEKAKTLSLRIPATTTWLAPPFQCHALLPDLSFQQISLEDYKGSFLLLFFYGRDHTDIARSEVLAVSALYPTLVSLGGCCVLGLSADSHYSHLAWSSQEAPPSGGGVGRLLFPLGSDVTGSIARDYGVNEFIRAVFLIDPRGVVRSTMLTDLSVAHSLDELLKAITSIHSMRDC